LTKKQQLVAYQHKSFWQCMDTKREHEYLNELSKLKNIPWVFENKP